ncbi:unnamed protein product [Cercospora beticola]|nr:unnamed protein product [Cercospora beticola]
MELYSIRLIDADTIDPDPVDPKSEHSLNDELTETYDLLEAWGVALFSVHKLAKIYLFPEPSVRSDRVRRDLVRNQFLHLQRADVQ